MSGNIKLLPDALANKIAAGEVVQNPASVVKELLENALDAGATEIDLIISDAGKSLIQVIDNGSGMNDIDARMSFERHATSKINSIEDLEKINTMGFRGEALASIASVSQVTLKTRTADNELGSWIDVKGSKVTKQESCQHPVGSSLAVRNLFYNVPARRKFLKKDSKELSFILNEFNRSTLARPDVRFRFVKDEKEMFHLPASNLKQRIINLFGKKLNEGILPIEQDMEWVKITGYIGKPDKVKKKRGDQYFFINNRFIKSHYLGHAVKSGYDNLIPNDYHPAYYLFLEMAPDKVDVNVHPTKHEVKFDEEQILYNFLRVAIKHTLGKYALTPMINFENPSMSFAPPKHNIPPRSSSNPNLDDWKKLYQTDGPSNEEAVVQKEGGVIIQSQIEQDENVLFNPEDKEPVQFHQGYLLQQIKSGILVIEQNAAHERVLYERNLEVLDSGEIRTQKELFPRVVHFSKTDYVLINSIISEVRCLGFEVEDFGNDALIIHGIPSHLVHVQQDAEKLLVDLLTEYKVNQELRLGVKENIARSMARKCAVKKGQALEKTQMNELVDALFACSNPYTSPFGRKCFFILDHKELFNRFSK